MADFSLSPNMSLPVPTVGTAPGPDWATLLNNCLTLVDSHNHAAGSGVQITPDGFNINTDLSFNLIWNAIMVRSIRFNPSFAGILANPTDKACVYSTLGDLYYNNGAGTPVQITNGGSVAGAAGNITNLTSPASASYVSGNSTFFWQSNANVAANMDFGSAILRNISPNSTFGVTLQPPAGLSSNYSITLPPLPGSTSFVTMNTSGALVASNSTTNGITRANLVAVGQQVSASSGSFASTSPVAVTNLSVTITTTGRPVMVMLIPDGTVSSVIGYDSPNPNGFVSFNIQRSATKISVLFVSNGSSGAASGIFTWPPSAMNTLDVVAAGTYTYTMAIDALGASSTGRVSNCKLVAYEL